MRREMSEILARKPRSKMTKEQLEFAQKGEAMIEKRIAESKEKKPKTLEEIALELEGL